MGKVLRTGELTLGNVVSDREIEARKEHLILPETRSYPLICKGRGAKLWDANGKEYIDWHAGPGVANVGYCHPKMTEALKSQIEKLSSCPMNLWHMPFIELVDAFEAILPAHLARFYLINGGAEAVEGAIKLAKKHCLCQKKAGTHIVALQHAFHGRTALTNTLNGLPKSKSGQYNFANYPGVEHIPAPYCYRCRLEYPKCGIYCATVLENVINSEGADDVAAFIYEPVLGAGGIIVPPREYHEIVQKICRKHGIHMICDEVFTGFGRTGKMFAFQHFGIEPDIVALAKGLGSGFPVGAFAARDEIGLSLAANDHGVSVGGNPLACTAAKACIEVIKEERLPENAMKIGGIIMESFKELEEKSSIIGEVRGLGLAIGIEIVQDKGTKAPGSSEAARLRKELLKRGVIVGTAAQFNNVIRVNPPLVITEEEVKKAIDAFSDSLKSV